LSEAIKGVVSKVTSVLQQGVDWVIAKISDGFSYISELLIGKGISWSEFFKENLLAPIVNYIQKFNPTSHPINIFKSAKNNSNTPMPVDLFKKLRLNDMASKALEIKLKEHLPSKLGTLAETVVTAPIAAAGGAVGMLGGQAISEAAHSAGKIVNMSVTTATRGIFMKNQILDILISLCNLFTDPCHLLLIIS
jgi:hypothetical protein